MKCDNCGKIYVLTNPDYPSDYYIGSTTQTYLAKRYYRHKQEYAKGSKSYGNIFKSDNHEIRAIEWHSNISVKDLCIRERFYIDYYKALGNNVNNQRMPHSSLEEIKRKKKAYAREYYVNQIRPRNALLSQKIVPVAPV